MALLLGYLFEKVFFNSGNAFEGSSFFSLFYSQSPVREDYSFTLSSLDLPVLFFYIRLDYGLFFFFSATAYLSETASLLLHASGDYLISFGSECRF